MALSHTAHTTTSRLSRRSSSKLVALSGVFVCFLQLDDCERTEWVECGQNADLNLGFKTRLFHTEWGIAMAKGAKRAKRAFFLFFFSSFGHYEYSPLFLYISPFFLSIGVDIPYWINLFFSFGNKCIST